MALTLAKPGLRAVDDGHEYVMNRQPDEIGRTRLTDLLGRDDCGRCIVSYHGGAALHVAGLTDDTRPAFENLLRTSLLQINLDHDEAEIVFGGGAFFAESAEARREADAAEIQASFGVLPRTLP